MEKALKMGKDSAIGSFQLFIAKAASTVILAVGAIILGLFILEGDYGLYTIALILSIPKPLAHVESMGSIPKP